jgi:replicative DNA helicase
MVPGTITQREATVESYKQYQSILTRPTGLYGTDTGLHTLNMVTGGHVPTNITTFAGRSGLGKTSIITPMCEAAAREGERRSELLVCSWEMTAAKLINRYICYRTGLTLAHLKYPKILDDRQRKAIEEAYAIASKFPIHYHQYSTSLSAVKKMVEDFVEKVSRKAIVNDTPIQPVFVLDYIGRIQSEGKGNRTYDIQGFLYGIKELCNKFGISALILAQINRGADKQEFPVVADLSDSSFIEAASDNIILLHRPEYHGQTMMKHPVYQSDIPTRDKALFRIVKARESAPGDILVNCDIARFRWWAEEDKFSDQYWTRYKSDEFWEKNINM